MPNADRKLIIDEPLGYGQAVCSECGTLGERRWPTHITHICGHCLFPPHHVNEALQADPTLNDYLPVMSMIQRLNERNLSIGRIHTDNRLQHDTD
jgi:hypothetical protein